MRRRSRILIAAPAVTLAAVAGLWRAGVLASDDPTITTIQYNREIVRIFQRRCISCHGADAFVPLDSYREVVPWARAIREELLERRMPPWPAARGLRPLENDPTLTLREMTVITTWTDGGTPRGDAADLPPKVPEQEWRAGAPDLTVTLPRQAILSDGEPKVRRAAVTPPTTEDRWLRGFDLKPGDATALRSAFLFLRTAEGRERWLGGWTPWYAMTHPPEGTGYLLPAGATLNVELYYMAWDDPARELTDESRIALYFQSRPPAALLEERVIATSRVAGQADRDGRPRSRGEARVEAETVLWALNPRLERNGVPVEGSVEVSAVRPDGAVEPLLWLNASTAEWQFPYVLREPAHLPPGSRIVVTAYASRADGGGPAAARVAITGYAPPVPNVPTTATASAASRK